MREGARVGTADSRSPADPRQRPSRSRARGQIVIDIHAGLGNRIFQYAAGRALALEGHPVAFSDQPYDAGPAHGIADLEDLGCRLDRASRLSEIRTGNLEFGTTSPLRKVAELNFRFVRPFNRRTRYLEAFEPRDPSAPLTPPLRLHGFFQHRSWYEPALPLVLSELGARLGPLRDRVPAHDLVINLRRGDYVSCGFALPVSFYRNALEALQGRTFDTVIIVSDDRAVESFFCDLLERDGFTCTTAGRFDGVALGQRPDRIADAAVRDFLLIAQARNLVMSNSTFCWWAAVLNDLWHPGPEDRTVVFPTGWLGAECDYTDDLKRDTWVAVAP